MSSALETMTIKCWITEMKTMFLSLKEFANLDFLLHADGYTWSQNHIWTCTFNRNVFLLQPVK